MCLSLVKNDYCLIWIKIDKNILLSDEDAYICHIYVREPKSSVLRHEEIDYFELLQQDISKYKRLGKIFVTGDFNSRTGQGTELLDYLCYDNYIDVGMNENLRDSEIPLRKSTDLVVDNYGRRLLDLCKATDLLIANGRLDTDRSIGEFTCITSRGRSVVDYLLLSLCDFECVSHFSICDVDEHSDHSALYFCLKLMNNDVIYNHRKNASTPTKKLVWSCINQELFRSKLVNQFGI